MEEYSDLPSEIRQPTSPSISKGTSHWEGKDAASVAGHADELDSYHATFTPGGDTLKYFQSNELSEKLLQWNLDGMEVECFKTNRRWDPSRPADLLKCILSNPQIMSRMKMPCWQNPGMVAFKELSVSVTSMSFFDRLEQSGIVSSSGYIRKCMDEDFSGVYVNDLLREMLLNEESERVQIFSEKEKDEFLFHIFRIFAVGGSLCQPDDSISTYLDCAKKAYKDLVSVHRSTKTGKLQISTKVFQVSGAQDGHSLFPEDENGRSFLYVLLEERKRMVTCWFRRHSSYW